MSTAVERLFSVSGKRVLITGGTRGVGLMIARAMSEAGAQLIVASRKPEACAAAAAELGCPGAQRLAPDNVTVNAIAPWPFVSKMTAFKLGDATGRSAVKAIIPFGRVGQPDDIGGTAIFLSARASAYMTGTAVPVDGGFSGCK